MAAAYLDWLTDVFEEAQVRYDGTTADYLDKAVRNLVNAPAEPEEMVFRRLRERWLRHGVPGRQLLAGLIRDEVYSRRDSPFRPQEGGAYYTNAYQPKHLPPHRAS